MEVRPLLPQRPKLLLRGRTWLQCGCFESDNFTPFSHLQKIMHVSLMVLVSPARGRLSRIVNMD